MLLQKVSLISIDNKIYIVNWQNPNACSVINGFTTNTLNHVCGYWIYVPNDQKLALLIHICIRTHLKHIIQGLIDSTLGRILALHAAEMVWCMALYKIPESRVRSKP